MADPVFSDPLFVLVSQLMNELRKNEGLPFDIVIYDRDLELAQNRTQLWREILAKNLLREENSFNIRVAFPADRGEVTQVVLVVNR